MRMCQKNWRMSSGAELEYRKQEPPHAMGETDGGCAAQLWHLGPVKSLGRWTEILIGAPLGTRTESSPLAIR